MSVNDSFWTGNQLSKLVSYKTGGKFQTDDKVAEQMDAQMGTEWM